MQSPVLFLIFMKGWMLYVSKYLSIQTQTISSLGSLMEELKSNPLNGCLTKADLQFSYSLDLSGDISDPHAENNFKQDNTVLDRDDGDQVLCFVNEFAKQHPDLGEEKVVALRTERILKTIIPDDISSCKDMTSWLVHSWHRYSSI
ncbi:hypothetical protein QN346_20405 [Undibacterium sp. 5I1]|nr:hypothetical protein [Undibacterium sp. 5I1]